MDGFLVRYALRMEEASCEVAVQIAGCASQSAILSLGGESLPLA